MKINEQIAIKVLETVDSGLCIGMGNPIPGQMCVEAAVCYAMGLPHSDKPTCVAKSLRDLKIKINDNEWSSNEARAKGLRRLAIAQLGSADDLDEPEFTRKLANLAVTSCAAKALRVAAKVQKDQKHSDAMIYAAYRCEKEGTRDAALAGRVVAAAAAAAADDDASSSAAYAAAASAASSAAYAASSSSAASSAAAYAAAAVYASSADADAASAAAERDRVLSEFAEDVVQILIDLKAPGCQWLCLTDRPASRLNK